MKTLLTTIRNHRALKRTTLLSALLIAAALVVSFRSPFIATARNPTTESTILLQTDGAPFLESRTANNLITKLQNVLVAIEAFDTATFCSCLTAFINECQAQSEKKLTPEKNETD